MKKIAIIVVLLAAAILAAYRFYYTDPNIVNEEYLSSESYQALQENIQQERNAIADREAVLQAVVEQVLTQSRKYHHGLPYRLDSLALDSILQRENRLSIPDMRIMPSDFTDYNFYGVIMFEGENYRAVLSLIELPGVYRDLEVGLTTVKDGTITDTALIGRYEKNPEEKTFTEVVIDADKNIRVDMNKTRLYPFKQEQNVSYRYRVTKDGNIESNVL